MMKNIYLLQAKLDERKILFTIPVFIARDSLTVKKIIFVCPTEKK